MQPNSEDALGVWRRPVSISKKRCRLKIIEMTLGKVNSHCETDININVNFNIWSSGTRFLWASKFEDIDKSEKIIYKYLKCMCTNYKFRGLKVKVKITILHLRAGIKCVHYIEKELLIL